MGLRGGIIKVIINLLDQSPKIIFYKMIGEEKIKHKIRRNRSFNYHDHLTVFQFRKDHSIYDLIVEVNYRYVYD